MLRRSFLLGTVALPFAARAATSRAPALFVQHGPYFPMQREARAPLEAWSQRLPTVRGIVAMTPHFGGRAMTYGPSGPAQLLYNVPPDIIPQLPQDLRYPSPPDDELGKRVGALLRLDPQRTSKTGLEHTLWMPLMYLFPDARAPILQLSFPLTPRADLFALGQALSPLLDENIAVVGSGSVSHNLALWAAHENRVAGTKPTWVDDFHAWTKERLEAHDVDALRDWRHKAPAADLNHPDGGEHFRVLLFALGAATGRGSVPRVDFAARFAGVQLG